jgi:uncharacterized membrane protein YbhN (UPF0104 family)
MVMNAIPLTPGGIGITESTFSFLFEAIGSSNGAAIGLLGRFIQYSTFAAAGSVAVFTVRFRRRANEGLRPVPGSLRSEVAK